MIKASIILDPWNVPRSKEQAGQLMDHLLRILAKKARAMPARDWMRPTLRRERDASGAVRYILEARERPPVVWLGEPLMNNHPASQP